MLIAGIYILAVIASYFANRWYVKRFTVCSWEMNIVSGLLAVCLPIFSLAIAITCFYADRIKIRKRFTEDGYPYGVKLKDWKKNPIKGPITYTPIK